MPEKKREGAFLKKYTTQKSSDYWEKPNTEIPEEPLDVLGSDYLQVSPL